MCVPHTPLFILHWLSINNAWGSGQPGLCLSSGTCELELADRKDQRLRIWEQRGLRRNVQEGHRRVWGPWGVAVLPSPHPPWLTGEGVSLWDAVPIFCFSCLCLRTPE